MKNRKIAHMWKKWAQMSACVLTRLGSKYEDYWHIWAPNVETIDEFELRVSTVEVSFPLFSGKKSEIQDFSPMN